MLKRGVCLTSKSWYQLIAKVVVNTASKLLVNPCFIRLYSLFCAKSAKIMVLVSLQTRPTFWMSGLLRVLTGSEVYLALSLLIVLERRVRLLFKKHEALFCLPVILLNWISIKRKKCWFLSKITLEHTVEVALSFCGFVVNATLVWPPFAQVITLPEVFTLISEFTV